MYNVDSFLQEAYEYGRKAEVCRRNRDVANSFLNDEEGIKYLEKAINVSVTGKEEIIRKLIRVCVGTAEDYIQFNDFSNAYKISEKICKYGEILDELGFVEKPTPLGYTVSEPLAPFIKELANYFKEKINKSSSMTDFDIRISFEISERLYQLIMNNLPKVLKIKKPHYKNRKVTDKIINDKWICGVCKTSNNLKEDFCTECGKEYWPE